jgi:hypothetical protein
MQLADDHPRERFGGSPAVGGVSALCGYTPFAISILAISIFTVSAAAKARG